VHKGAPELPTAETVGRKPAVTDKWPRPSPGNRCSAGSPAGRAKIRWSLRNDDTGRWHLIRQRPGSDEPDVVCCRDAGSDDRGRACHPSV